MIDDAKTQALQEPDVVVAARAVIQVERRRLRNWSLCLVAGGVVVLAAVLAGMYDVSYYLGAAVVVLAVVMTLSAYRNREAAKARSVLDTWERVVSESLGIEIDSGPASEDPRWDRAVEQLGAIRHAAPATEDVDQTLRAIRVRLREGIDRLAVIADASRLDCEVSGEEDPLQRLRDASEEIEETVASLVDRLERAAALAGDDVGAALEALR